MNVAFCKHPALTHLLGTGGWFGSSGEREGNETTRLRARTLGLGSSAAINQPSILEPLLLLLALCSFFIEREDVKAPFCFSTVC